MALALILALESTRDGLVVRFDIGKNRYLRWQLGEEERTTRNGLPSLAEIKKRSGLIGPLGPENRGRGELVIPVRDLKHDWRCLQLVSFRERNGEGPAISEVATLRATATHRQPNDSAHENVPLPPPAGLALTNDTAAVATTRNQTMTTVERTYTQAVDNVPFALSERKLSQTMFLQAIVGALPSLMPMLAPAIGSLVSGVAPAVGQVAGNLVRSISGGGGGGSDQGQRTAVNQIGNLANQVLRALGPAARQILTPENMRRVMQLIQAGSNAGGSAQTAPAPTTPTTTTTAAASQALTQYSHAQVAPLLAALPALMPLLRQVLNPQTVQSIVQAPERMTGQVINGIKDFARLGLEADAQLQGHLERLNPGVDDPALHQLLASLSLEMSASRSRNYKRVASVRLQIDEVLAQVVFGREIPLYSHSNALQFPLSVETPQTINDAEVMLQLKQADTLRIVYETSEKVGAVSSGPLELIPRVESNITQSLDPQKDHIAILTLLWRNSRGQLRGTSIQHSFGLMGKYRFDRVEESGELIALDDRETYRDYWHQIWETNFDRETRRADIQSRYYLTLDPQRNRNARMDSDLRVEEDGPRAKIRLRSGYQYSLYALNHLMSRLAPEQPALSEDILQALANNDFVERFNQAAQHQGQLRGRPGDRAALWTYPEFKLQKLVLVKAGQINENGNITDLGEERVTFPMPVMMHFIGVISE